MDYKVFVVYAARPEFVGWENPNASPPNSFFPPNATNDQKAAMTVTWKDVTSKLRRSIAFFGDDELVSRATTENPAQLPADLKARYDAILLYYTQAFAALVSAGIVAPQAPQSLMGGIPPEKMVEAMTTAFAGLDLDNPGTIDPHKAADQFVRALTGDGHKADDIKPLLPDEPPAPPNNAPIDLSKLSVNQLLAEIGKRQMV